MSEDLAVRAEPKTLGMFEICGLIPHRPPMLLVDSALVISDTEIEGRLTIQAKHCLGHFEGNPLFPAVDMCEVAFQTAGVLVGHRQGHLVQGVAAKIREACFKGMVRPNELLTMRVRIMRERLGLLWLTAEGRVGDRLVYTGEQTISSNIPSPPAS